MFVSFFLIATKEISYVILVVKLDKRFKGLESDRVFSELPMLSRDCR